MSEKQSDITLNSDEHILFYFNSQGNAELLSISSDDSIWNSEDDDGDKSYTGNFDS